MPNEPTSKIGLRYEIFSNKEAILFHCRITRAGDMKRRIAAGFIVTTIEHALDDWREDVTVEDVDFFSNEETVLVQCRITGADHATRRKAMEIICEAVERDLNEVGYREVAVRRLP